MTTGPCNCRWHQLSCVHLLHLLQIGRTCNPSSLFLRHLPLCSCVNEPLLDYETYIEVIYHHLPHRSHIPILFLSPRLFAGVTTCVSHPRPKTTIVFFSLSKELLTFSQIQREKSEKKESVLKMCFRQSEPELKLDPQIGGIGTIG